ncbi:hypothetical protein BGX26_001012 [Mortierella sp. AD094]|nr:hypothetical protein BGX26_001012 [Mortierella sp. AD094]
MKFTTIAIAILAPIVTMASCLPDNVNTLERREITTEASGKKGQLYVKLNRANKLTNKDWIGKSDPFIEMWIEKSYKQRSKDNRGQDPVYDETFCFYIRPGQSKLNIRAVDSDTFSNDKIGETSISLDGVMNTGNAAAQDYALPKWFGFSDNGSVNVQMQFVEDTSP